MGFSLTFLSKYVNNICPTHVGQKNELLKKPDCKGFFVNYIFIYKLQIKVAGK